MRWLIHHGSGGRDSAAAPDPIADFSNQMVREHGAMNQELAALAKEKGVEPPTSASLTDQAKDAVMSVMPGTTFDKQYVGEQLTAPKETLALMEKQASGGDDPDLKSLAANSIPVVQRHTTEF